MLQTTLRDYLHTTEDAISSGNVNDALASCQHILSRFPDLLEAQRLLGEVYLAQGRLEEAQQTFDWVLTNDPENVIAYCSRALVSERMSEYDTALDCYQQAYELSRGNSQIRQEFNQLSGKVGQQGFIFSRAGLARLYMRGDLLPQAIQEWETVLAMTPDRLDARTGLLEAYWREGLYDRVEQLATQILEDVPGCLKALLLLAHVTFAQDALKTEELMQQVATLDLDLMMAQDLFSDFMVSQPKDPFLALLKKAPAVFSENSNGQYTEQESTAAREGAASGTKGTPSSATFSDPLVRWSSLDNIIEPQQDYQTMQDASPIGTWASNSPAGLEPWSNFTQQDHAAPSIQDLPTQSNSSLSEFDAWHTFSPPDQQATQEAAARSASSSTSMPEYDTWSVFDQQQPPQEEMTQSVSDRSTFDARNSFDQDDNSMVHEASTTASQPDNDIPDFDSWNTLSDDSETSAQQEPWHIQQAQQDSHEDSEAAHLHDQQSSEQQQPWYHMDMFAESTPWSAMPPLESTTSAATWGAEEKAADLPAPPAWLDMLTKGGRRQSGSLPKQSSTASPAPVVSEPLDLMVKPSTSRKEEPQLHTPLPQEEINEVAPAQPLASSDDEEAFFFGPEWLKSLGATTMDSPSLLEEEIATSPASKRTQPLVANQPQTVSSLQAEDEVATPSITSEAALVSTPPVVPEPAPVEAETKEQMSVENWLDRAAQRLAQPEQNILTTLEELEKDLRSQGFMPLEPGALASLAQSTQEPSLSSALAQLGNLIPQSTNEVQPAQAAQPETTPAIAEAEPLWPTSTTANAFAAMTSSAANKPQDMPPAPISHLDALSNYVSRLPAQAPFRAEPTPVHVDALSSLVSNTVPSPTFNAPMAPTGVPATPTVQDIELETTMKRPAVRLQGMQQPAIQKNQVISKGRPNSSSTTNKASEGNLNYKDRLLKGYQYQLAGSYDDAMQEYRIIIRNAPDLLGEVVSNMRALLKLAPKYAAGYRVLGDAYMRQGEYLQAMEAYNKALTMAKKAKS